MMAGLQLQEIKLSAQYEHTIGVTDNGYEIFTLSKNEKDKINELSK